MKKLLLIAALATMATTAMAASQTKAEVLVKAEIVNESLKITDIDGNPLVLDFKKLPKRNYSKDMAEAHVEYKITSNVPAETDPINLGMSFTSYVSPENNTGINRIEIVNENISGAVGVNDKVEVNLALDSDTKTIAAKESTAVGQINGTINTDLSAKNVGLYTGKVFLRAEIK